MIRLTCCALLALTAGCAANTSTPPPPGDSGSPGTPSGDGGCGPVSWDQDVAPIVQAYCTGCHGQPPNYGAPASLVTYADTQAISYENPVMTEYQMMALKLGAGLMPASGPKPSPDEVALVLAWADAGAPESSCPGMDSGVYDAGQVGTFDAGQIDTSTANFKGTAAGFIDSPDAGIESNEYRCFSFTLDTGGQTVDALEFAPIVDNSRILHHMVVYRISGSPTLPANYECFGGPSPSGTQLNASFLYGWAPGVGPWKFPTDVGMPLHPGDELVVQIHYHNFTGVPQPDSSGVAIWWTPQMQTYTASVMRLGPSAFVLEPAQTDVQVSGSCTLPSGTSTLQVFGAAPHMHLYGTQIATELTAGGNSQTLVSVSPWDFNAQQIHPIQQVLQAGDQLVTTCHYDTMGATGPIKFGETTEDEMCFDFLYVYPTTAGTVPGACNN